MPPTCHLSKCLLLATDLPPACHRLATHAHGLPTHWHPQHALRSGNPHFGLISFDNVPVAFLLIFQAITLEGWTDIMSYLMNGVSPFFGGVYMVRPSLTLHPPPNSPTTRHPTPESNPNPSPNQVLLVLLVAWFLTNLALAVIYEQVLMAQKAQVKERDAARQRAADAASPRASFGAGQRKPLAVVAVADPSAKTAAPAAAETKARYDWLGPPRSRFGLWCAKVIAMRWFGMLFPGLILLNTLLMCAPPHAPLTPRHCSLLATCCAPPTRPLLTRPPRAPPPPGASRGTACRIAWSRGSSTPPPASR